MRILTFDIEDWFHLLDNPSTKTHTEWCNYETRIKYNVERILNILANNQIKATFFCLGWIAETYPDIMKAIVNNGHEIGSHSHMHQLVYEQVPVEFEKDLELSIKTLEDITGQKVKYFRAPGFSITKDTKWAFEILVKAGIEVDCSIFPASRSHGGFTSYRSPVPSIIKYDGYEIKELPINYRTFLGIPIIFSGGGYFRLFPYNLIKKWTENSDYVMSYLHPRDFDSEQPVITDLSMVRKFKSYYGLRRSEQKFNSWLADFTFIDVSTAVRQIDWDHVIKIDLS
jgi:polysaccharide deacetylase family protein (PEP-CTERM system associated)